MSFVPEAPPEMAPDDVLDTLEGLPDAVVLQPCAHDCDPDGVPGGDPTAVRSGGDLRSAPAVPVRPGGDIRPPVKLRHVLPAYPDIARVAGVQGVVVLDCTIGVEGRVSDVKVLGGPILLQAAAADAVRQWRYRPTYLNGVAIPIVMTVTVRFTLGR
jgi:protein TonB